MHFVYFLKKNFQRKRGPQTSRGPG